MFHCPLNMGDKMKKYSLLIDFLDGTDIEREEFERLGDLLNFMKAMDFRKDQVKNVLAGYRVQHYNSTYFLTIF
jgi:hypothetical protein